MHSFTAWQSYSGYKYGTAITTNKVNSNYYDLYQHYRDKVV